MWGAALSPDTRAQPLLDSLETAALLALVLDATGRVTFSNARARDLLARAGDDVTAHLRQHLAALAGGTPTVRSEQVINDAGAQIRLRWSSTPYAGRQGQGRGLLAIGDDVTEEREREQQLVSLALHDPLTGLPNRALLADRLAQALLVATRQSLPCALLVLDLDGFKSLNDERGHAAGDELLRQIGPRLRGELRDSDTVARLGGDEFAILLPPPSDLLAALAAAHKISTALAAPFTIDGQSVTAEASVGIGLFPDHAQDADGLGRAADLAMYAAKRSRRDIAVYDPQDDLRSPALLEQIDRLKHAIEADGLCLEYQPSRDLRTGAVARAEALVRWDHPSLGLLLPGAFMPLAERTGLMKPLASWVLTRALRDCASWRAAGNPTGVSVNLSLRELTDPELPAMASTALRDAGLPPEALTFELNERHLGNEPRRIEHALSELDAIGVRLALDDFGRGDLSMRSLQSFPLDEVKLDPRLIGSLFSDARSWAFVRGGIDLGHDLGMQVVAKGVEDAVTRDLLTRLGCDVGQGNFFARPLAAGAVWENLRVASLN
jgi:diguanylate cyclase (GGDEF)-like protein